MPIKFAVKIVRLKLSATKQAISIIKLVTTVGHCLRDLDSANVYMARPSCVFLPAYVVCFCLWFVAEEQKMMMADGVYLYIYTSQSLRAIVACSVHSVG